jgi:ABC-type antimicrobial peptide transport system permease subunit
LPEREKPSFLEKLAKSAVDRVVGEVGKSVQRRIKRILRMVGLVIAGTMIAVLGLVFLAIGVVKWFSVMMPSWLAWLVVGLLLFLLGLLLALVGFVSSRG